MAWPYDDELFVPGAAQRMPQFAMPPPDEPDLLEELTAPQEPTPDDFFARMAQSGPQPFTPAPLGPKPTGLEVLVALLGSFVNAKTARGARRISETEERNQRAREAAKDLAKRRWERRDMEARANLNLRNILASRKPPESLTDVESRAEAAARGRRRGAPLAPRVTATAPKVKPGPLMPELTATTSNLMSESGSFERQGKTAQADSTRNLAGRIKDVHAAIRQAQSVVDLDAIEVPDSAPPSVVAKIKMAYQNRKRQLGATR